MQHLRTRGRGSVRHETVLTTNNETIKRQLPNVGIGSSGRGWLDCYRQSCPQRIGSSSADSR